MYLTIYPLFLEGRNKIYFFCFVALSAEIIEKIVNFFFQLYTDNIFLYFEPTGFEQFSLEERFHPVMSNLGLVCCELATFFDYVSYRLFSFFAETASVYFFLSGFFSVGVSLHFVLIHLMWVVMLNVLIYLCIVRLIVFHEQYCLCSYYSVSVFPCGGSSHTLIRCRLFLVVHFKIIIVKILTFLLFQFSDES